VIAFAPEAVEVAAAAEGVDAEAIAEQASPSDADPAVQGVEESS
jgi:hypothetical protein